MSHYSERYLNSGVRKAAQERFLEPIGRGIRSFEVTITDFVPAGDKAHIAGFRTGYWGKDYLRETTLIKENGEWRFYGNQRDAPSSN